MVMISVRLWVVTARRRLETSSGSRVDPRGWRTNIKRAGLRAGATRVELGLLAASPNPHGCLMMARGQRLGDARPMVRAVAGDRCEEMGAQGVWRRSAACVEQ